MNMDRLLCKARIMEQPRQGQWITGYYVHTNLGKSVHAIRTPQGVGYLVDPSTICQCTGLKDKNGQLIFEGDIFDIHQTVNGCNLFIVNSTELGFGAEYYCEMATPRNYEYDLVELFEVNAEATPPYEKTIEVIGNIHDKNVD